MKTDVTTLEATKSGTVDLSDSVYGLELRADLLHRMVNYQLASRQAGTHKTKTVVKLSVLLKNSVAKRVAVAHVMVTANLIFLLVVVAHMALFSEAMRLNCRRKFAHLR